MTHGRLPRGVGDIQTAVVNLVETLAPVIPLALQPAAAHAIASHIADRPCAMAHAMALRQSIIRGATASTAQVADGLAAWITVLFDLANLLHDRARAMATPMTVPDDDVARLKRCPRGAILTVPHIGAIELFCAHLVDRGFTVGFVFTIGADPTPTEQWLLSGRRGIGARPIPFGRRDTGAAIASILDRGGVVLMVADVYPTARFAGIPVRMHGGTFTLPPGPARFARSGARILPGFASRRTETGVSARILDPIDGEGDALTQRMADHLGRFTADHPDSFWLWHPIPNDPFLAEAHRRGLPLAPADPDEEAVARTIDAIDPGAMAARWA